MIYSASYAAHAKSIDLRESNFENNPSSRSRQVGQIKKQWLLVMKLTAVLVLVACLQVSARGFGQGTVTISLRDVLVTEVFKEIEKQTSFRFLYRDELVKKAGVITIAMKDATVQDVLNKCFERKPLEYKIFKETIVISEKGGSVSTGGGTGMMEVPLPLINVTGRVLNEQGKPVEGVTVTIKGTDKSTSTNSNGEFFLSSVEQDAVLVFTSVNMETFELKVSGKTQLVVNLKAKVSELGGVEVVVNTGYEQVPKERATGSFSFVTKEQLDQRVATDIISKLEGITNGLVFNKDAIDGSNKLRIRGESTIFANPNPLIVVDNFPYDGDINNINPNDVESITILKDAAAASIWGVQAGNGVIVITTKKAKRNQPLKVELNANATIIEKPDLFYAPLLSPTHYIDFENVLFENGFYDGALDDANLRAVSPVVEILNDLRNSTITEAEANSRLNALRNFDLRNDQKKYIYLNAVNQQYQVNFSTGGNKASYYFSAGYDKNLTVLKGNGADRITFNSNAVLNPIKNLDLNLGLSYNEGRTTNNAISSIPNAYPYMRLVDDNGQQLSVPQHRAMFEDTIAARGFLDWRYYPLRERESRDYESKLFNTRFSGSLSYTIIKGLAVEGSYQYQRQTTKSKNLDLPNSYFIRDLYNKFAIVDADGNFAGSNFNNQQLNRGLLNLSNSDLVGHYGRVNLRFNREWTDHAINVIAGLEAKEVTTTNTSNRYYGFDDATGSFITSTNLYGTFNTYPSLTPEFFATPEIGISYTGTKNRFRSYYSNMTYIFKRKYAISASARFDGSNYFGVETNKKTVPLWSVGGKWDISKENFFSINAISNLSLRITYGYNGNLAQNMAAITTFDYSTVNADYTGLPYAGINNIPNPNLRWEKSGHFNLGLDFGLLNNRIAGSLEYFQKRGDDLIGIAYLDPTTGVSQFTGNFSGMETKGFDINIQTRNIEKALKWSTVFNLNFSKEKVTRYDVNNGALTYLSAFVTVNPIVGKPLYSLYSYRWAGLDPATGDPRFYISDTVSQDYSSSLNSKFTMNDLVFSGKYMPPVVGSIQNTFSWRRLTLSFNILFKLGHYFRRQSVNYSTMIQQGWQGSHEDYLLRWTKPGDENITNVPSFEYPGDSKRDAYFAQSDILVEKADHVRLQFVNLNYSINPLALKIRAITNLNVFFYANNVGILWRANDKGIDPDFPYLVAPPSRSYSFGLRVGF